MDIDQNQMLFEQLNHKKILVAGGAGFLGSHVVARLYSLGVREEDIIISHSHQHDLRREEKAKELLHRSKPDIVICLAARLSGIGDNIARPAQYFLDNIRIGINLIEASREVGIEKFVYIGTVCSYPREIPLPFQEKDLWSGYPEPSNAAYGIAKRAIGAYLQAAYTQYGFPSVQLILTNLYGPGDDFRDSTSHVIPALIKKVSSALLAKETQIVAWGDGSATRDFIYASDAAEGIVKAAAFHDHPSPVNLASGKEISIKSLLQHICRQYKYNGDIIWDKNKPNGQPKRILDISRARELLGFEPKVGLESGLAETIKWYNENREAINMKPEKYCD
jgi:GDP-L-fucose synthase